MATPPIDYGALANQARSSGIDYAAMADQARQTSYGTPPPVTGKPMSKAEAQPFVRPLPAAATQQAPDAAAQALAGIASVAKGAWNTVRHPIDTAAGLVEAQGNEARKIGPAYRAGRTSESLGHSLAAAVPVIGPMAASLADTATGNPEMPPKQSIPGEQPVPPQPWRAATEAAAMAVAPRVAGKMADVRLPESVQVAGAATKGAVTGATRGVYDSFADVTPRELRHTTVTGAVLGTGVQAVRGAAKGARSAIADYNAKKLVGDTSRTPLWSGVPDSSAAPPPSVASILSDLPSGRTAGPAAPPIPPPRVSLADQRGITATPPQPPPSAPPIPSALPSGRKVGGIQNMEDAPPVPKPAAVNADNQLFEDTAISLTGKRYAKLSAEDQARVRDVASKMRQPNAAPPIPQAAPPAPAPAQRMVVKPDEVAGKAPPDSAWPKHVLTEDGIRAQAAEHGVSEADALKAVVQNGYQVMGRSDLNRLLHAIGGELGMDHPALGDVARQTYKVRSLSQLSQDQMLEMYHDLLGKRAASNPLAPKVGDTRLHNGKPVTITKLYPDGTADIE